MSHEPREWLAISYRVPSEPSRNRVYVWRKLKELGAVYLQQGVGVLPRTEAILDDLQALRAEVLSMGGESAVAILSFVNQEDEDRLVREFQALRDQEYDEIVEECEKLIWELERETEKGKFTFMEIEENEQNLANLRRWTEKVAARDYFGSPGRDRAAAMLERAAARVQEYNDEVYRREIES